MFASRTMPAFTPMHATRSTSTAVAPQAVDADLRGATRAPLVSLQYLRALAALLVVYLHSSLQVNHLGGHPSASLPEVGKCGVDIFFVLSGYVMWISTDRPRARVGEFLLRRLIRIAPLYWLVTAVAITVSVAAPQLLQSTKFEVHHALASLLFVPWPNPIHSSASAVEYLELLKPIVTPGWTLNFEMFFYGLFAVGLLFPIRRRLAALVIILTLAYAVFAGLTPPRHPLRFYGSDLLFEFLAGICLAAVPSFRAAVGGGRFCVPWFGAALLVLVGAEAWDPGLPRALVLGLPAAILVAAAVTFESSGRLRFIRLLNDLGDASYSIYLTHVFVVAGSRIIPRQVNLDPAALGGPGYVGMCLVLAAGCGLLIHRYVERPMLGALGRWLLARPPRRDLGRAG